MELKEIKAETVTEIYQQYMTTDFPQNELKPLERILYTMEIGLCCAYGIYEQNNLRGYAIFIVPDGLRYGLLDYLAVLNAYRGTGVGHAFFELIGETLSAKYPLLKGFFIESESIEYAVDEQERDIRERRIAFYIKNGCSLTAMGSKLFGVTYSILTYNFDKKDDTPALLEDLNNVYTAMFKKHHYENNVAIWQQRRYPNCYAIW